MNDKLNNLKNQAVLAKTKGSNISIPIDVDLLLMIISRLEQADIALKAYACGLGSIELTGATSTANKYFSDWQ